MERSHKFEKPRDKSVKIDERKRDKKLQEKEESQIQRKKVKSSKIKMESVKEEILKPKTQLLKIDPKYFGKDFVMKTAKMHTDYVYSDQISKLMINDKEPFDSKESFKQKIIEPINRKMFG